MRLLYTIWCGFWFLGLYLVLFPFQYVFLQRPDWKPLAHRVNRVWGQLFFFLVGIPVRVEYRFRPEPRGTYVIVANHFSYLDIAAMGVILDNFYAFVGKSEVKRIPMLGYMFAKLHIQVNRERSDSRAYSLTKSIRTLASGRSVMIFPEGGIKAKHPPKMAHPFKDGAFIMAIQQQVPIVPVVLINNHHILPEKRKVRVYRQPLRAVVLPPIDTRGLTQDDVPRLKEQAYQLLDDELMKTEQPETYAS